jgi:hypothetical protein
VHNGVNRSFSIKIYLTTVIEFRKYRTVTAFTIDRRIDDGDCTLRKIIVKRLPCSLYISMDSSPALISSFSRKFTFPKLTSGVTSCCMGFPVKVLILLLNYTGQDLHFANDLYECTVIYMFSRATKFEIMLIHTSILPTKFQIHSSELCIRAFYDNIWYIAEVLFMNFHQFHSYVELIQNCKVSIV